MTAQCSDIVKISNLDWIMISLTLKMCRSFCFRPGLAPLDTTQEFSNQKAAYNANWKITVYLYVIFLYGEFLIRYLKHTNIIHTVQMTWNYV